MFSVRAGAALGLLAVALGAFGTHVLGDALESRRLDTFEIAVRYQMYHALALLALGALPRAIHVAAPFFLFGSMIFSGSLYLLVLTNMSWFGAITPIGGILQILGWGTVFVKAGLLTSRIED